MGNSSEKAGHRAKVTQLCPVSVCYVTKASSHAHEGVCQPHCPCPGQPPLGTPGPSQLPAHFLTSLPFSSLPPSTLSFSEEVLAWPSLPSIPATPRLGLPWTSQSPFKLASLVHNHPTPRAMAKQRHPHTRPLVPEGPHGDAVLPHKAPHGAATTFHAWLGGGESSRGPPSLSCEPGPLPTGGCLSSLAVRSLPSSWWEEERKGPKSRGEGALLAPTRHHRSLSPALLSLGQLGGTGSVWLLQILLAEQPLHIRPDGFCTTLCLLLARR